MGALTVGSLFAGIGGFDLGLERAGMRSMWQCEIDPYAIRVLEKHWPDVLRVRDIRDVGPGTVPAVDVICGGFPCQDISYAGLGAGIAGERSGLWSEMLRVIRELRPRWVVVENVSALLARGLDVVLGGLAACGYDAEWDCIPAAAVGAPHRRDRIWLVAYPNASAWDSPWRPGEALPQSCEVERSGRRGGRDAGDVADANGERFQAGTAQRHDPARLAPGGDESAHLGDAEGDGRGSRGQGRPDPAGTGEREPERALQDADSSALQPWRVGGRAAQAGGPEWWAVEPPVGRVAHGVPDRLDQLATLGNALVPQVAELIGRRIIDYEEEGLSDAA